MVVTGSGHRKDGGSCEDGEEELQVQGNHDGKTCGKKTGSVVAKERMGVEGERDGNLGSSMGLFYSRSEGRLRVGRLAWDVSRRIPSTVSPKSPLPEMPIYVWSQGRAWPRNMSIDTLLRIHKWLRNANIANIGARCSILVQPESRKASTTWIQNIQAHSADTNTLRTI